MHADELLPPAQAALIDALVERDEAKWQWHLATADALAAIAALAAHADPLAPEAAEALQMHLDAQGELAKAQALLDLMEARQEGAREAWKAVRGW